MAARPGELSTSGGDLVLLAVPADVDRLCDAPFTPAKRPRENDLSKVAGRVVAPGNQKSGKSLAVSGENRVSRSAMDSPREHGEKVKSVWIGLAI